MGAKPNKDLPNVIAADRLPSNRQSNKTIIPPTQTKPASTLAVRQQNSIPMMDCFKLEEVIEIVERSRGKYLNVRFFLGLSKLPDSGETFEDIIIGWKGNFVLTEARHDFIQWLFPNFFRSQFNPDSFPLTSEEAKMIRQTPELSSKMIEAYKFIYSFFGIELDVLTGKVSKASNYVERMKMTLIGSPHNRLRMRRILTNMHNVGFKRYAFELVDFLISEMERGALSRLAKTEFYRFVPTYGRDASLKLLQANFCLDERKILIEDSIFCLLYTSPSPRDRQKSRMPSSA
eukprot:TRINITY_DN11488_c0_g3_i1.p1 TRINITY_DN11488_c0_g3~~TRINITY_DN11488_c0_g3_i1.p1  ORF type:complete len:289 (-),score=51.00 TRINITY_DN11488_c0_g3_i1:10-876(-)